MSPHEPAAAEGEGPAELLRRAQAAGHRVLLVAAHPDDETIGAGARLGLLAGAHVVFVTDGAPRDGADARAHGFDTPAEYARARRGEALAALALAGIGSGAVTWLEIPDQQAVRHLAALARRVRGLLAELDPALVLTHPYEGGHPDHDATAFAVHLGRALCVRARGHAAPLVEFASYHAEPSAPGGVRRLDFLPSPRPVVTDRLGAPAEARKRAMLACYASQREVLRDFPTDVERFRQAPAYDFAWAPHPGPLHYERFGWGTDAAAFCAGAQAALAELGTSAAPPRA